jgi:flagellar biosynthesis protein FliR
MTIDSAQMLGALTPGLRGFAAVGAMTSLVGGIPRWIQALLAVSCGAWTAVVIGARVHEPAWPVALAELVLGAALGVVAAVPLVAARAAGSLVDWAAASRAGGPYEALFGVLAGAVFLGIDGHIAVVEAVVHSHREMPMLGRQGAGVVAAIGRLVPTAIRLAMPWLVTAAIVQLSIGVGSRLAGRASAHVPHALGVPAALVMMTATLVGTLSIAVIAVVRGTL